MADQRLSLVLATSMAALVLASAFAAARIGGLPLLGAERLSESLEPRALEALVGFLAAAGLALWLASGGLGGPYAAPRDLPAGLAIEEPLREERLKRCVDWFVRMRWLVLVLASGLIAAACFALRMLDTWLALPLGLCVTVLAAANFAIARLATTHSPARRLLHLQIGIDLVALTFMLHYSGGFENPLSLLYLFHVLLAGMLLSKVECYITALGASALFAALGLLELSKTVPHYTLAMFSTSITPESFRALSPAYVVIRFATQTFALGATAYLTGLIAEHQRSTERELLAMSTRALTESQKLHSVVESAGAGLMLLDPQQRLLWFNRYAGEWLALGPQSLLSPWVPRTDEAPTGDPSQDVPQHPAGPGAGSSTGFEITVRRPGKPARILRVTSTPVRDSLDQVVQIVTLLHDITALHQARAQLLHATKLAAIGELAGSMAHEVNNPVAIIAGKARLMLGDYGGRLPDRVESELAKVVEQADRLSAMTRRLLSACRPTPGRKEPTSIDDVVAAVLDLVDGRIKESKVSSTFRPGCKGLKTMANAGELSQVVLNLVNNALDASPAGGSLTLETTIETAHVPESHRHLVLRVTDTGSGIPAGSFAHLFEPFFTTKSDGRGTGLGLAISLGIVQDHGGEIGVESTPGCGTTFTVRLPALDSEEKQ